MFDLPHEFLDPELLRQALTHASCSDRGDPGSAPSHNERLEFLGDAVLDLVVADELYRCHPDLPEGDLTELKAWVVSRRTLAEAARGLGLEQAARVGSGMRGRALPPSVLANLYEAVLGAVYRDGGLEAARAFALSSLAGQLERARDRQTGPNPKQMLQQRCQQASGSPPDYTLLEQRGQAHARAFLVAAEFDGRRFPSAWGRTVKEAERWAAHEALLVLDDEASA